MKKSIEKQKKQCGNFNQANPAYGNNKDLAVK
jgi:hypothetical protein